MLKEVSGKGDIFVDKEIIWGMVSRICFKPTAVAIIIPLWSILGWHVLGWMHNT